MNAAIFAEWVRNKSTEKIQDSTWIRTQGLLDTSQMLLYTTKPLEPLAEEQKTSYISNIT